MNIPTLGFIFTLYIGVHISVVGLGNPFMGDDSVGIRVIDSLSSLFNHPRVKFYRLFNDFLNLIEIFETSEVVIIVDAVKGEEEEGTIYTFEGVERLIYDVTSLSTHTLNLREVVDMYKTLRGRLPFIYIVGIEPSSFDGVDYVSEKVEGKIPLLVNRVRDIIRRHIQD